jgi:HEAT repeat protein
MSPARRLGRSLGGMAVLVGLCALPAHGRDDSLTPQILYALTPIDTSPTKEDLRQIFGEPAEAIAALRQYAGDPGIDFGLQLRAIRAIPHFCQDEPAPCHDALVAQFDEVASDSPGQRLLRKRAAIEALGAARSGAPEDLARLIGFLGDGSRDLRVAAVRALRDLCDPAALAPLQQRRPMETVLQVSRAIDEALLVLGQCGP